MVLPNFKENLEKYAKLLVANGINVQPGHTLALSIDVEQRELAHLIVKEAYAWVRMRLSFSGQMMSLTVRNSSMRQWSVWTMCQNTRLLR